MTQRLLLCIMDGWGIANCDDGNAVCIAKTPNFDKLKNEEHYTTIHADGEYVGLPDGQMGNSEVGHLNLGAGRIVYQDLTRINKAIKDGSFFKNPQLIEAIDYAVKNNSSLHLMGLVSNGGVHSSMEHIKALIKFAAAKGLKKVYIHAFLDGRDTPPKSALGFLSEIEDELKKYNLPKIATVSGRFWAMDRDNRWDRVEKAYNCLVDGCDNKQISAFDAVKNSYNNNKTDEFVEPAQIGDNSTRINDNDSIIFFNFRPDRAREITKALMFKDFDGFKRATVRKNLHYTSMTQYDEKFNYPIAFGPEELTNILGSWLASHDVKQFRTAETEKYAHVTFFFNGGIETPNKNEVRKLVSSPKVATYDLQPEMSAPEVCEGVLEALKNPEYGFILVNFANPDMVGHTGIISAAIKAVETVDTCVGKIAQACKDNGVIMLLTADHGNAEKMINSDNTPYTAHTTNPVPFLIINSKKDLKLRNDGALCDVAPTVLELMHIEKPIEMTGKSIITKD